MLREGGRGKAGRVPRVQAVNVRIERPYPLRDVDCSSVRPYPRCMWQHPWLRIECLIRSILADRLTRGPSESVDQGARENPTGRLVELKPTKCPECSLAKCIRPEALTALALSSADKPHLRRETLQSHSRAGYPLGMLAFRNTLRKSRSSRSRRNSSRKTSLLTFCFLNCE